MNDSDESGAHRAWRLLWLVLRLVDIRWVLLFAADVARSAPLAGVLWVATSAASAFTFHGPHPPMNVDPRSGCDFNGNCVATFGLQMRVKNREGQVFSLRIPDGQRTVWIERGPFAIDDTLPNSSQDSVGVDLTDPSGEISIAVRYCPRSGACANPRFGAYGSPRDYVRAAIAQRVRARRRRITGSPQLPILTSRAIAGTWRGRRALEFGYAYGGVIRSKTQKVFPDRIRCDTVLIATAGGLLVASYTAPEARFPSGMMAFSRVLESLRVRGTAGPQARSLASVPQFPSLTLIPARHTASERRR